MEEKTGKQNTPVGVPANTTPPGTPVQQRRAAASNSNNKMAAPIVQPTTDHGADPNAHIELNDALDIDELEKQLQQTPMVVRPDENKDQVTFDPAARKPGVKVYDANKVLERRRRILQNLGISDLLLPPIQKQTMATYRVIAQTPINPSTQKPADPQDVSFPGTYLLYDIGEADPSRRSVVMRNLTGKPGLQINPNTGKEETVPNSWDWVDFRRGVVIVDTVKEFIKYIFLELHPLNGTNKFRDRKQPPIFERVDIKPQKSYMLDAATMDMARDAEDTVLKMDKDRVIAFAASANIPTMENGKPRRSDEMKHDLRVYARNSPKQFFALSGNTKAAIRSNVIDLKNLGLIEFDPDKSKWFDFNTDQTIYVVPRGEDPTLSLVEFLNEPEHEYIYQALLKLLNYWVREDWQLVEYEAA